MGKMLIADTEIWAYEGTIMVPDRVIYQEGNVENNLDKRPRGPIHNYLFRRTDRNIQAILREGLTGWDPREKYMKHGFARVNNVLYISIADNNVGNDPRSSNLWSQYGTPVGTPIPWVHEVSPPGYASFKGQAFDISVAPLCAAIYGSTLPDMTGCGVLGVRAGEQVFKYQAGEVKGHLHGLTIASDTHGHPVSNLRSNEATANVSMQGPQDKKGYPDGSGDWSNSGAVNHSYWRGKTGPNMAANGKHTHVSSGNTNAVAHSHQAECEVVGGPFNTTDHRKVNWIVRLA